MSGIEEAALVSFLAEGGVADVAHDLAHVRRVVRSATRLAEDCGADREVVRLAAWLHDCVAVAKDSPDRARASTLAAERADRWLAEQGVDPAVRAGVHHAIQAHSFSAGIPPESLEAQVVQDADRLDALGAIGLARCLMVGAQLGRPLYDPADPFCARRAADDSHATLDHFFTKLLRLPETMQTEVGREEARRRANYLRDFLAQLGTEIGVEPPEPAGS